MKTQTFKMYGTMRVNLPFYDRRKMYGPYLVRDNGMRCFEYDRPILPRAEDFNLLFAWKRNHSALIYISNGYSGTIKQAIFEKHILKHLSKPRRKN